MENKQKPEYSIVLNTHIPQSERPWAYEALFHCYLPLFEKIKKYPVTMGLSPQLILEFTSKDFKDKSYNWYNFTIDKVKKIEVEKLKRYYIEYYTFYLNMLESVNFDLKKLWQNNNWEILAYPSTHCVLPLVSEKMIKIFLNEGEEIIKDFFNVKDFSGVWLPEMAFETGPNNLHKVLSKKYDYIYGNWRTIDHIGHYNNLYMDKDTGLKLVIRNDGAQQNIWGNRSEIAAYPEYRESFRTDYHGNKIFKIGEDLYSPESAIKSLSDSVNQSKRALENEKGDYVALMFDTEYFGHHWWEGKYYLPELLSHINEGLTTTEEISKKYKPIPMDINEVSYSWGSMGDERSNSNLETWVNGATHRYLQYYREMMIKVENWDKKKIKDNIEKLNLLFSSDWLFNISNKNGDIYDFTFDNTKFSKDMIVKTFEEIKDL